MSNLGSESSSSCVKCGSDVRNSLFCGECGSAVLQNILVKSKTTADYDPRGPTYAPWREPVALPPRLLKPLDGAAPKFFNDQPWRPSNGKLRPTKKRINKKKPSKKAETSSEEMDQLAQSSAVTPADGWGSSFGLTDDEKAKLKDLGVHFFQGAAWQRAGFVEKEDVHIEPPVVMEEEDTTGQVEETMYPVAIYRAVWLDPVRFVYVSIFERSWSTGKGNCVAQRWLRVTANLEAKPKKRRTRHDGADDDASPSPVPDKYSNYLDERAAEKASLSELAYDADDLIAKSIADSSSRILDFSDVGPDGKVGDYGDGNEEADTWEQTELIEFLPDKVAAVMVPQEANYVEINAVKAEEYYIYHHLEKVYKHFALRLHSSHLSSGPRTKIDQWIRVCCVQKRPDAPMRVVQCESKSKLKHAHLAGDLLRRKVYLDKTVAQMSAKIRLGDYFENKHVLCDVSVSLAWSSPVTDVPPELLRGEGKYYLKSFLEPRVTSITLTLTPLYSGAMVTCAPACPKRVTFHADAIQHLIERDLDAAVTEGYRALDALIWELLLLLRMEERSGAESMAEQLIAGSENTQYESIADQIMAKFGLDTDSTVLDSIENSNVDEVPMTPDAVSQAPEVETGNEEQRKERVDIAEGKQVESGEKRDEKGNEQKEEEKESLAPRLVLLIGGVFEADAYDMSVLNRRYPPSDEELYLHANTIQTRARGILGRARFSHLRQEYEERRKNRMVSRIIGYWRTRKQRHIFIGHLIERALARRGRAITIIQRRARGVLGRAYVRRHREQLMRSLRITGDVMMKRGRMEVRAEFQQQGRVLDDWTYNWRILMRVKRLFVHRGRTGAGGEAEDTAERTEESEITEFKARPFAIEPVQVELMMDFLNNETPGFSNMYSMGSLRYDDHRSRVFGVLGHFLEVQMTNAKGVGARPRSRDRSSKSPDRAGSASSATRRPGSKQREKRSMKRVGSPDRAAGASVPEVALVLKFREVRNL